VYPEPATGSPRSPLIYREDLLTFSSHLHLSSDCYETRNCCRQRPLSSIKLPAVQTLGYCQREGSDVRGSTRTFDCSAETTVTGILLLHLRFSQRCYSDVGSAGQALSKERDVFIFKVRHCKKHVVLLDPFEESTTVVRNVGHYSPSGTASRPTKTACNTKCYEHVFAVHDKTQLCTFRSVRCCHPGWSGVGTDRTHCRISTNRHRGQF
jgi:hypothetical protein